MRRWLLATLLLVVVVALAAVPGVIGAKDDLDAAVIAADDGRAQLLAGDAQAALDAFTAARDHAADARRRLRSLPLRLVGVLPVVGANPRLAAGLADAATTAAEAGVIIAQGVADLPGGIAALAPQGSSVPVESLQALAGPLGDARRLMQRAGDAVPPASGVLLPQLVNARQDFRRQQGEALKALEVGEALAAALPRFLGSEGPRHYFFAAQNPAELRGTGGLMGAYAILTADQGRLSFSEFNPVQDLTSLPPGTVPPPNPDFADRYGFQNGTGFWLNLNLTPDFPSAAQAVENLWDATKPAGEPSLDGVIAADPFALAALLDATGPVQVPPFSEVTSETLVALISNEAYFEFDEAESPERKRLFGAVATAVVWSFLSSSGADPAAAAQVLGAATAAGHLKLQAVQADVQAALSLAGVDGSLPPTSTDTATVVLNNAAGNKTDYYAERTVTYDAVLAEDGGVNGTLSVNLLNGAPATGPPPYIIGPTTAAPNAGENLSIASLFCGTCEVLTATRDGAPDEQQEGTELGHAVQTSIVRLGSGEQTRLTWTWHRAEAWTRLGEGGAYDVTFGSQPTIRPTELIVRVQLPESTEVIEAPDGAVVEDGALVWRTTLDRRRTMHLVVDRPWGDRVRSAAEDLLSG